MTTGHDKQATSEQSVDAAAISRADFLRLIGGAAVVGASASLVGAGARPMFPLDPAPDFSPAVELYP